MFNVLAPLSGGTKSQFHVLSVSCQLLTHTVSPISVHSSVDRALAQTPGTFFVKSSYLLCQKFVPLRKHLSVSCVYVAKGGGCMGLKLGSRWNREWPPGGGAYKLLSGFIRFGPFQLVHKRQKLPRNGVALNF